MDSTIANILIVLASLMVITGEPEKKLYSSESEVTCLYAYCKIHAWFKYLSRRVRYGCKMPRWADIYKVV